MNIYIKSLLCFLFISIKGFSQNLTGTWEAYGNTYYKLVIVQVNDSCFGYTYDTGFGHCKANFIGTYNELSKKLAGLNPTFIDKNILHTLSVYNLAYYRSGDNEYLRGIMGPKQAGGKMGIPHGILYKKISDNIDTTKLMASKIQYYQSQTASSKIQKEEQVKPTQKTADTVVTPKADPVPDLKLVKESRTSALIKTLETEADSIRLVLYDNGEIDGDTVTVFYNGAMIHNSVPLNVKPIEVTLAVNKNMVVNTIELMANNLGSIPPNTALLLIYTGKERHELRVSSDYSTNARIDIKHIERP
jgi:lactam utilization protein B